jgi:glycosyltransferase involved in cell wall biosynthesis
MRIAVDIRALEGARHGGVVEYIRNLLPALFAQGSSHEFRLFTNARHSRLDERLFSSHPNVTLHRFGYPNKLFSLSCRYLNRPYCDQLVGGADVLFCPHFLPAPVSASCAKVITVHDISFEYYPEAFDARRGLWHRHYIAPKKQVRSADHVIAVSESTKDDLVRSYGIPPPNITVVYPGLNTTVLAEKTSGYGRVRRTYRLPHRYVLSFCALEPRKNIATLINAFTLLAQQRSFSDLHLVIAGAEGWSQKSIRRVAQRSAARERIHFTGVVKERDKAHLYRHAELFVYPSLYEGFGFPPLEALRCGVPTLVSAVSSLPEITGGAALLVDPNRPAELAEVMNEALSDARLRTHLIERGYARAKQFVWQNAAAQTLAVLERSARTSAQTT